MRRQLCVLLLLCLPYSLTAAEIRDSVDAETGWRVYTAQAGRTTMRVVPAAGFNVYSIEHAGRELLKIPKKLSELPGFMYGTPLLYPSPNRVRDAQFTFSGRKYKFEANNDAHFLHGLVHNVPWRVTGTRVEPHQAAIDAELEFAAGTEIFKLFPHEHTLRVTVTVTDGAVRWDYTVENPTGQAPVPFGFALHPWFLYQGERKDTFLTIPATHWMEAKELLPTGKLVELAGTKFDARKPKSLAGFVIDDVYFGMRPDAPTVIDFRDRRVKISLAASADFTHLVVYTPENEDWFCVENQTCSTDAHNLHRRGLNKESNLLIVPPGKSHSGHAEFRFEDGRKHKFSKWEPYIQKFEEQDRRRPPAKGGTVFVGSSSILFWDLPKYFPNRMLINRGFGGSVMLESLYFADRIVLPYAPRTIVVYAGDNDISRDQTAETVADDFRRFAAKVHAQLPETRIIYIAIKPSLKRWTLYPEMARANDLIAKMADGDERIVFADIATPMLGDDGKPKPELFIKDGLHLSDAGYRLWASIIDPLLGETK